jgi:lysophospholipase L1-like esterase
VKVYYYRCIIVLFLWLPGAAFSQSLCYPLENQNLPFVNYSRNKIDLFKDSSCYRTFFKKFDSLLLFGSGQIKIVHFGGSHIQADIYTHQIRRKFEFFQPGLTGYRGFIFPYKIALTNSPANYNVTYAGTWTSCRNVDKNDLCVLGVAGISVTAQDTSSSVKILLNNDPGLNFSFNRIKIFHPAGDTEFTPEISACSKKARNEEMRYTEFFFDSYFDSAEVFFRKTDSLQNKFELQGLSFESDLPGLVYSTIGVNGAKAESFLKCQLFESQIKALQPDMVILSFGTNEGYTLKFDREAFKKTYSELIQNIKTASPQTVFLITVPNDSYLFGKYANTNSSEIKNVIFEIAEENNLAVWDFYSIMGGFGSSSVWFRNGLMNKDRVHFNKEGYLVKGDLLFSAFIRTWESFINR